MGSSKPISTTLVDDELPDNGALKSSAKPTFGFMADVDMATVSESDCPTQFVKRKGNLASLLSGTRLRGNDRVTIEKSPTLENRKSNGQIASQTAQNRRKTAMNTMAITPTIVATIANWTSQRESSV